MHLLATASTTLDEIVEPIDLGQSPAAMAVLSFADSDLGGIAAAWAVDKEALPSLRLAHLRDLRHPMSIDLWIDRIGGEARVILVRLLGGLEWWRYGVERLAALARERGIALAVLPGEDRDDPRLVEASTLSGGELEQLLAFFREGGRENLRALLRHLARHAGASLLLEPPQSLARMGAYLPGAGVVGLDRLVAEKIPGRPNVPILFYRSMLLGADTAPIDALAAALAQRGLDPAPLFVTTLRDADSASFVRSALDELHPSVVVTTTAFAFGSEAAAALADIDVPVLQAVIATTKRAGWRDSPRGLGASDLAMHVVLPELDGRVLSGALAFKDPMPAHEELGFAPLANRPEPDRIAFVADRVAALVRLQRTPRSERRIAVLMPDYPGAPGRTGYAVGLDVPQSVVELLRDLAAAGYAVEEAPASSRTLLDAVNGAAAAKLDLDVYKHWLGDLPAGAIDRIDRAWGAPEQDPEACGGAFRFRALSVGRVTVALAPDRGRVSSRRADYHDAGLPPRHALLAFGLWLRNIAKVDGIVHMGAHGTIEWLPGKAVALTAACFPELVAGPVPIFYPFIVSNPGEAAQAKRRIAAVTIGHLPPPLTQGELSGEARELERLVDEYAQADGLDARRRERLAGLILQTARSMRIAGEAGAEGDLDPNQALRRIDAWLCDLKDLRIKDGLHVFGRTTETNDPAWRISADAERKAILAALDGRRVPAGPAGSPGRGRRDVLPTGRNLFTADPRMLPTETAMDLGRLAAEEVIRTYLQTHGEMPCAIMLDLWGSATLRTGGEEIAQGLALMGCRPNWDPTTGRVTGIEIQPTAVMGRPRVDVTWRISGLFRDLFPTQIALIDAAVRAVAGREEPDTDNPLAAASRACAGKPPEALTRIFGTAPGAYGAGIEDLFGQEADRNALGTAYLAAASHAYEGADGAAKPAPGAFADRVAQAQMLVHPGDDPGRDLLEGSADASFVGGFAAAASLFGRTPDLVMLDVTDPLRPRARSLGRALARIVRARAISSAYIEGQMRYGPRGAADFAETIDRLVAFAETTDAVPGSLLDLVHEAYVENRRVRDFLLRENPTAALAIAERLESARRRGLWHPRRNGVDADLATLRAEALP